MCGITGLFGRELDPIEGMMSCQQHRGPDASGTYRDPSGLAALGHNRLSIIDLSDAGRQPMASADGRHHLSFNGEIYNYIELRQQLRDYPFRSRSDSEVVLAAYQRWGEACLDRMVGMFAFMIWDSIDRQLFVARDRFGVKPVYYHQDAEGGLIIASEIKAIHAAGIPAEHDEATWSGYLVDGLYEHSDRTFWKGVRSLPPGHKMRWSDHRVTVERWYDLAESVGDEFDHRSEASVCEEYLELLKESVQLRFRSDVPVAVNLSGGLDSSLLLELIHQIQGEDSQVRVLTFATGDSNYDELPWVEQMLAQTQHPLTVGTLRPRDVPALAEQIADFQDEPYGGLPTLAYANLFCKARQEGTIVLLDGQGMDEAWAGYDYYAGLLNGQQVSAVPVVQGTRQPIMRTDCLMDDFRNSSPGKAEPPAVFSDALRCVQYRDARHTKLPRALRFNDRVSMAFSTELREPFLDHRLFELALKQPAERKRDGQTGKVLLRRLARDLLPDHLREAPKRPVQTPQREWLRGSLRDWASEWIDAALRNFGGTWLNEKAVRHQWAAYQDGASDNSFFVWQWISLGMCDDLARKRSLETSSQP